MGQKGEGTRRRIRQTAADLFAERGYTKVTMQEVCDACGLSKGGLYRHYANKAQLFSEILKELQAQEEEREASGMAEGGSARLLLRAYFAQEKRGSEQGGGLENALYEFCMDEKAGEGPRILQAQYRRGEAALQKLVAYGVERGEFWVQEPREAAAAILFLVEGLRMTGQAMPIGRETWEGVFRQIERMLGVGRNG